MPAFSSCNRARDATTHRANRLTRLDAICVLLLIAYFLHFALPARHGGFREDEMMNLWTYWYVGALNHSRRSRNFGRRLIGREVRFTIYPSIISSG